MSSPEPRVLAVPNFRTARLMGIFNALFAVEILACGLLMSAYVATLPLMARAMKQFTSQIEQQADRQKQTALKGLDEEAAKATTEAEKTAIAARREKIETAPKVMLAPGVDFSKMGFDDPTILTWSWVELLSGMGLNVMLLASGVGLMHWKPWGRTLGIWTGVLKIARLLVFYLLFIIFIVPPMSKVFGELAVDMMQQQQAAVGRQGGPPKDVFVRIYAVMYTVMGVGFAATGVIYPAVMVWILTRPGVVSASSGRFVLPKEPRQP